jgi:peptidoglycan/LPS O-acetylase OafA/YrhL
VPRPIYDRLSVTTSYRPEVDGLRAIAVLAVIVFHAWPRVVPGGFAGVDVFFVISGFLISGIIVDDLERGAFSLAVFYHRRIRRIFPGLVLVMLVVWVLGFLALTPREVDRIGLQMAYAGAFAANLFFWRDTGYFDMQADTKPLLHLWSLGVEEQFYLLWPPLLVWARRRRIRWAIVIGVVGALSFVVNVATVSASPRAAFFLPVGRLWELLCGAAVMLLARDAKRVVPRWIAWIGMGLVIESFVLLSPQSAFPGAWALLPTVGTSLVIAAGTESWIARHLLATRPFVFVGKISYPLYLWHWPLLALLRARAGGEPSDMAKAAVVAGALVAAWGTFALVEKPIRFRGAIGSRGLLAAMAATVAIALVTVHAGGFPGRSWVRSFEVEEQARKHDPGCVLPFDIESEAELCRTQSARPLTGIVLGDSHASAIYPGLVESASPDEGWGVVSAHWCVPLVGERFDGVWKASCPALSEKAIAAVSASPTIRYVVFAFAYDELSLGPDPRRQSEMIARALDATITRLEANRKAVALLVDNPHVSDSFTPWRCADCFISRRAHEEAIAPFRAMAARLRDAHPKLVVYDPADLLCDADRCPVMGREGSLYVYTHHLSTHAASVVASALVAALRPSPAAPPPAPLLAPR